MTESSKTTAAGPSSLDDCIEAILTAARKPQHYIKQELVPKTAPELFNSRTADDKACVQITLDDGRTMVADIVRIERQSIRIFAADNDSNPSSIDIKLKKRIW